MTELDVRTGTARYDRPIRVEGSNDRRTFVPLADGRITRDARFVSPAVEFTSTYRYLRVTIDNGDDEPLQLVRYDAYGPSRAIVVERGHPAPLTLYYGAPGVRAPSYEFARLAAERPLAVLVPARLPPERLNPAFAIPAQPFGERYRWLLQVALASAAVAVAFAGFLVLRRRA